MITLASHRIPFEDLLDASIPFPADNALPPRVTVTYDPSSVVTSPPAFHRTARGTATPCVIPPLVDERHGAGGDLRSVPSTEPTGQLPAEWKRQGKANPLNMNKAEDHAGQRLLAETALVDDLSPRTITAELDFETPDYEYYDACCEWEAY